MIGMFYEPSPDSRLRLGDVVVGFPIASAAFNLKCDGSFPDTYRIDVQQGFYAVLSPCCAIGYNTILLCPFQPIQKKWLKNPYFAQDMTNINRPMKAELAVSPEDWEALGDEKRQERLDRTSPDGSYVSNELFVYASHDLLQSYKLTHNEQEIVIGHWVVDFRKACRIECQQITYPQKPNSPIIQYKRLQLTISARADLRDKLAFYFGNPAPEDVAE
jgi:hypothetical protein